MVYRGVSRDTLSHFSQKRREVGHPCYLPPSLPSPSLLFPFVTVSLSTFNFSLGELFQFC